MVLGFSITGLCNNLGLSLWAQVGREGGGRLRARGTQQERGLRGCAHFEMEENHSPRNVGRLLMLEKPRTGILPRITMYWSGVPRGKELIGYIDTGR